MIEFTFKCSCDDTAFFTERKSCDKHRREAIKTYDKCFECSGPILIDKIPIHLETEERGKEMDDIKEKVKSKKIRSKKAKKAEEIIDLSKRCLTCGKVLSRQNVSGYCARHTAVVKNKTRMVIEFFNYPEIHEKIKKDAKYINQTPSQRVFFILKQFYSPEKQPESVGSK